MRYFGPPHLCKTWETQVSTPVGCVCMLCDEPIAEGDIGTINMASQITHYECGLRMVVGTAGHLNRLCSCYGGTEEDPPGMTRRQAAQAATAIWESRQAASLPPFLRTEADAEAAPPTPTERDHGN